MLADVGDCVVQSHAGYSRCGLGSDGTDRLVALVRQEQALARLHQEPPVLFGAKITGGGSGGQFLACSGTSCHDHSLFCSRFGAAVPYCL